MPTRTLTKVGPTVTLESAGPAFDLDGGALTVAGQYDNSPYLLLEYNTSLLFGTNYATGSQNAAAYLSVARDVSSVQGFVTTEAKFTQNIGDSVTVVLPQAADKAVAFCYQNLGGVNVSTHSFYDSVLVNSGLRAHIAADRVVTFDRTTAPGWGSRTLLSTIGFFNENAFAAIDDGVNYSNNLIYDTTSTPGTFVGVSVNRAGAVTFFNAFDHASVAYSDMNDATNFGNIMFTTQVDDGSLWTCIESFVGIAPADYVVIRVVNWFKNGPSTGYTLAFSDATDQADFVAALTSYEGPRTSLMGGRVVISIKNTSGTSQDFLVVSPDWTTYERFNMRPGVVDTEIYRYDLDGFHYGIRDFMGPNESIYRLYPDGIPTPDPPLPAPEIDPPAETNSPVIRSWGFTLDSHEIYVNRLGGQSTLLFDAKTAQWSRWASNSRPVWRAHQGFNWLGMSTDNYSAGATSNVVCGDDASGVLWTLEPDAGSDDTPFLPVEQELFPRRVIGGVPARSRQAARNSLVSMTVDVGDPVDSDIGSEMRLEISDNYGKTWDDCGIQTIPAGSFGKDVMWRSLGLVRQPGRLFRFTDFGATTRIDGVDVIIDAGDGR